MIFHPATLLNYSMSPSKVANSWDFHIKYHVIWEKCDCDFTQAHIVAWFRWPITMQFRWPMSDVFLSDPLDIVAWNPCLNGKQRRWRQDGGRVGSPNYLSIPNYPINFKSPWIPRNSAWDLKRKQLECYSERRVHASIKYNIFGHSALSKMTRRKTLHQRKESETVPLPQSYKIWVTIQCQKANSEAQV